MSFLNLPWQWDRVDTGGVFEPVRTPRITRWRRGPVTFYRFEFYLSKGVFDHNAMRLIEPPMTFVQWWVFIADDFGLALTLPWWKS